MANKNRLKKAKQFAKKIAKRIQNQVSKEVQRRRSQISRYEIPNPEFEYEKRKQDDEEIKRLKKDEEFRNRFSEGELTYNSVLRMIDEVDKSHRKAAQHLDDVLQNEIAEHGDVAMITISFAPGYLIENAEVALRYNPGDERHDGAIHEIEELIRGHLLSEEENKTLEYLIEQDIVWTY